MSKVIVVVVQILFGGRRVDYRKEPIIFTLIKP